MLFRSIRALTGGASKPYEQAAEKIHNYKQNRPVRLSQNQTGSSNEVQRPSKKLDIDSKCNSIDTKKDSTKNTPKK